MNLAAFKSVALIMAALAFCLGDACACLSKLDGVVHQTGHSSQAAAGHHVSIEKSQGSHDHQKPQAPCAGECGGDCGQSVDVAIASPAAKLQLTLASAGAPTRQIFGVGLAVQNRPPLVLSTLTSRRKSGVSPVLKKIRLLI